MKVLKSLLRRFVKRKHIVNWLLHDKYFDETARLSQLERAKTPNRTVIINYLIALVEGVQYLEIGVRNPNDNFNHINCKHKYSVDPGVEFNSDRIDFKMTSNDFFEQLEANKSLLPNQLFDVIFVDGLHLAYQCEQDIINSLKFIHDDGFIVLHDCNPPTEFHQREDYYFRNSPAKAYWSGTTWKAFFKFRHRQDLYSICFDTDWGIGVISKKKFPLFNNLHKMENPYFEFNQLHKNKNFHLNLQEFNFWKDNLESELKLRQVF